MWLNNIGKAYMDRKDVDLEGEEVEELVAEAFYLDIGENLWLMKEVDLDLSSLDCNDMD